MPGKQASKYKYEVSNLTAMVMMVSNVFGASSLTVYRHHESWIARDSRGWRVYSGLFILAMIIITIIGTYVDLKVEKSRSAKAADMVSFFVWISDMALMEFLMVLVFMSGSGINRTTLDILRNLNESQLKPRRKTKYPEWLTMLMTTIIIVGFGLLMVYDVELQIVEAIAFKKEHRILYAYTAYNMLYISVLMMEMLFILTSSSINTAMRTVNDTLLHELQQIEERRAYPNESLNTVLDTMYLLERIDKKESFAIQSTACITIKYLAKKHGVLCDLVLKLNDKYGAVLLTEVLFFLQHLIGAPYHLLAYIVTENYDPKPLLVQITWVIAHAVNMWAVIEPCHIISEELTRTKELVSRMLRNVSPSDPVYLYLDLFSKQLLLSSAQYAPLGMCILNRALISTIVGSVTTYLVIIVQFRNK